MPSVIGQMLRNRSVEERLGGFFRPDADPWDRLQIEVLPAVFSAACTRAFADYLQGPSQVDVRDLQSICTWLQACTAVPDATLFFTEDFWQHPVTFEQLRKGDCEDHALWAWRQLHRLGIPALFMSGLWRATPHAWINLTCDGIEHVLETTAKSGPMLIPLSEARRHYCPAVAVDHHLATYVYQGFQNRHAYACGPSATTSSPTHSGGCRSAAEPSEPSLAKEAAGSRFNIPTHGGPDSNAPPNFEIAILAGGKSSRMGRDKARLRISGRSLLARVRAVAAALGGPVRVIRKDDVPACGPLGGMLTALRRTGSDIVLFLGCDMPSLRPELLRRVLAQFGPDIDAACVTQDGQPGFPFALRRGARTTIENQIEHGRLSLRQLTEALPTALIEASAEEVEQLRNLNTPQELDAYRQDLAQRARARSPRRRRSGGALPLAGWLAPFLLLFGLSFARAAEPVSDRVTPEEWLPHETVGFVSIPAMAWARTELPRHGPTAFWFDPATKPLRADFEARLEEKIYRPLAELSGVHLGQLLDLAQGQVTFAWLDPVPQASSAPEAPLGFLVAVNVGSRTNPLAALFNAARTRVATNGLAVARPLTIANAETLHLRLPAQHLDRLLASAFPHPDGAPVTGLTNAPPVDLFAGILGSWFVATTATNTFEGIVARLRGAPPVSRFPIFTTSDPGATNRLLQAFLHAPRALAHATSGPPAQASALGVASPGSPRFLNALGLDQLRGASFEVRSEPDGWFSEIRLALPPVARRGIFRLLQPLPTDASPPDWIPEDILSFTRLRLPGPSAWAALQRILRDIDPAVLGVVQLFTEYAGRTEDVDFNFERGLIARLGDDWITASRQANDTNVWGADLLVHGSPQAAEVGHALTLIASPTYLATFLPPGAPAPLRTHHAIAGHRVASVELPPFPWQSGGKRWLHIATRAPWVGMAGTLGTIDRFLTLTNPATSLAQSPDFARALARVGGAQGGFVAYNWERESARHAFQLLTRGREPLEDLMRWAAVSEITTRAVLAAISWIDFQKLPPYERVARHFRFRVESGRSGPEGWSLTTFRPSSPPSTPPPPPLPDAKPAPKAP